MIDTPDHWHEVEHHVKASLERMNEGYTLWDVVEKIHLGHVQWHWHNGCALITKVSEGPKGDICLIWLSAGNIEAIKENEKYVSKWARDIGCIEMRYVGRRGWTRIIPDYREAGIIARKDL